MQQEANALNLNSNMSITNNLQENDELVRLRRENAELRTKDNAPVKCKVAEKGGLSVYGLGRFPTTLYKEQWEKLLANADVIRQALRDNAHRLKSKGD